MKTVLLSVIIWAFTAVSNPAGASGLAMPSQWGMHPDIAAAVTFTAPSETVIKNDEQPLAIVRRFRPTVNVRESAAQQWVEARVAQPLFHSDTLRTEQDGYAVVQMVDNSLIRVRPNSMLIIRGDVNERGGVNSRIDVERGGLNLQVSGRNSEYEVGTQTAVAAVKGTRFSVTLNSDGTTTIVCFTGALDVIARESGRSVELRGGRRALVNSSGQAVQTERVSRREMRRLEAEEVQLEEASVPDVLRIRLQNSDGDIREIEIPYFRNEKP